MTDLETYIAANIDHLSHDFPDGDVELYKSRISTISGKFRHGTLKFVDQLANANDGEFYTIHGPSHINTILKRTYQLLTGENDCLLITGYEAFLLVVAIYAHDSAMIYGREDHQINLQKVITDIAGKDELTLNREERRKVAIIARAHTKDKQNNRDTITSLASSEVVGGKTIRTQYLAAILRMADQLSDDRSRSAVGRVDVAGIPEHARVYHYFLSAIDSIVFDKSQSLTTIQFRLEHQDIKRTFGKKSEYLWDFLVDEMMKWFREFFYCSRFTRPYFELRSLLFNVVVYNDGSASDISDDFDGITDIISFDFAEKLFDEEFLLTVDQGYPFPSNAYDLCPTLEKYNGGGKLDGPRLLDEVKSRGVRA
jgi:hypothetical protein